MNFRYKLYFVAAGLLLLCTGCVNETVEGTTQTFTYELWVPISLLIGGLAATLIGWFFRDVLGRFGWALLVLGPLLAVFFAPSMFRDRAVVTETAFSLRTGIWGLTSVHEVEYDDLAMIRITLEESRGRRGRKRSNYYLVCKLNDGSEAKVPMNNKVAEAAAPAFLGHAAKLGVPIVDQTPLTR